MKKTLWQGRMKRSICLVMVVFILLGITGCDMGISIGDVHQGAGEKVRDLDFTVLSEERIPKELLDLLEEKKAEPFELTYSDKEFLYICIGYGKQDYSGHNIVVNELFLGEHGILIDTSLIGPKVGAEKMDVVQYPMIVVKTELIQDTPLFAK